MFSFSLEKQKNRWSQFVKTRKYKVSVLGLNSATDWKFVWLGLVIVIVLVAVNGYSMYKDVVEISEKEIEVEVVRGETVDIELVDEKISFYEDKQAVLDTMFFTPKVSGDSDDKEGDDEEGGGEEEIGEDDDDGSTPEE